MALSGGPRDFVSHPRALGSSPALARFESASPRGAWIAASPAGQPLNGGVDWFGIGPLVGETWETT